MKAVQLYAQVVIKKVNIVISRCCFGEDGTDLFINACRTCSTLIFLTRPIKLFICGVVDAKALYYHQLGATRLVGYLSLHIQRAFVE